LCAGDEQFYEEDISCAHAHLIAHLIAHCIAAVSSLAAVQHRIFESSSKSWETLCAEASAFASEIGRENLVNISVAASGRDRHAGPWGTGPHTIGSTKSASVYPDRATENAMRWILSITVAVCLAAASSTARPLDTSCENERRPQPEDGALEGDKEQNRAQNNFCAGGSPVTVTKKTFKDLEAKAEALEQATARSAHPFAGVSLSATSEPGLVLADVTLIDGNGGAPLPGMTLVLAGDHIADIFPSGQKPLPRDAVVLDLHDRYVIPGLIDSHVHVTRRPDEVTRGLAQLLREGVTAVRDMGGDPAWLADLNETTASPLAPSPRVKFAVVLAGPMPFGRPRRLPTIAGTLAGVLPWLVTFADHTPVRQTATFARTVGAVGIKVYSDIPSTRVRELAGESHRQGLKVWGHTRIFPGKPSDAVNAGVEVLSHSTLLACEVAQADRSCDYKAKVDSPALDRLFSLMRDQGTILEPTLAVQRDASIAAGANPRHLESTPSYRWGIAVTRRAHALGVRIAAGSDLPLLESLSAPAIHQEMELLVTAGLTPLEAITAATRTGAEILGESAVRGTLEIGKQADIVVLAADPTRDIRHTRQVSHVIKGGHMIVNGASSLQSR
jgi:imidazolonepropionase-like amidohydrolase